jgi:hypothetical protein
MAMQTSCKHLSFAFMIGARLRMICLLHRGEGRFGLEETMTPILCRARVVICCTVYDDALPSAQRWVTVC